MSSNLVIVAVPAADDLVWKVSSEKIPHLTLLFLGDAENNPKVNSIFQFVWHAVNVSEHGPFYLDVDRRDVLGEDKADVLHFRKSWEFKWINQFRNQLLQNSDIRTAYDSTEQFPEWQPHLTLGYPETPAHEDKIPEYGLHSVRFDRIAVWTGNYVGPEFRLEWPEREEALAVAYSNVGEAAVEELLHFGVKGMKWGVRKDRATGGVKKAAKATARFIQDVNFENRAGEGQEARDGIIDEATSAFYRKDLPKINAKPEYQAAKGLKTRLRNPTDPVVRQYRNETKQAYIKRLESTANSMKNASGTREYTIRERGGDLPDSKYFWEVSTRTARHAADDYEGTTVLEVIMDEDGFITSFNQVDAEESSLAQTAIHGEEFVDSLIHYGIKGMRWGQRKAPPPPVAPRAVSKVPHGAKRKTKIETEGGENQPASEDAIKVAQAKAKLQKSGPAALSNKELQEVAQRIELEQRVKRAVQPAGRKFVTNLLRNQGNQGANQFVSKQVKKKFVPA